MYNNYHIKGDGIYTITQDKRRTGEPQTSFANLITNMNVHLDFVITNKSKLQYM